MDGEAGFDLLCVCLAPTLQKTLVFDAFRVGGVNRAREAYLDASGKGVNAARIAVQSGGSALHLTHLGGGQADLFRRLCEADGVELDAPACPAEIRTCVTIVDLSSGTESELVEECPPVPPIAWRLVKERYARLLARTRAVLLSGKPAAGYPDDAIPYLAKAAKEAGKPLVLDVRGRALADSLEHSPDICKPNAAELAESYALLGIPPGTAAGDAAALLSARFGTAFLVTDGPRPAILAMDGGCQALPVERVRAINPIGSGDACAAGMALSLARGMGAREACLEGLRLGSLNATTVRPGRLPGF
jgi:1-phosphofructokinase/tagatose 6-phosphate kinase